MFKKADAQKRFREHSLERIVQACATIQNASLEEIAIREHEKRRNQWKLSDATGHAQFRPIFFQDFLHFQLHVPVLRSKPVRQ